MGLFEFKIRQFSKIMKWADMQVVCSQCLLRKITEEAGKEPMSVEEFKYRKQVIWEQNKE